MAHHERAMAAYVTLARVSHERSQQLPRDKFLVLAAAAACRSGWPDVARRCRAVVLGSNPAHQLGHTASVADALRSEEFPVLLKRLERFCHYERAEHLVRSLGIEPPADESAGAAALRELEAVGW